MIKIIFLDIDGVLNVYGNGRDMFGSIFESHFIDNLKRIIDETGAQIVISSTWRHDGIDFIKAMWSYRNYPGEVIDITPCHMKKTGSTLQRGKEIQEWLNSRNDIFNYVILDDDTDMEEYQLNNFVQCSQNINHIDCVDIGYGLTTECTLKAINILNRLN